MTDLTEIAGAGITNDGTPVAINGHKGPDGALLEITVNTGQDFSSVPNAVALTDEEASLINNKVGRGLPIA